MVSTEDGLIQGTTYLNKELNILYQEFKGIPYAEPPIGELRFKAPVKHKGWKLIRNATEHGPNCEVSEDCLYLNVYTTSVKSKRPVMVYIHGGAFISGSGDSNFFGPSYFMKDNVVVVTLNYRLGAFGFLSTGDEVIQGNYGLKDQLLALIWVNQNIEAFGGDVNSITIFGESAGSASVEYLILSPLAKGLFHRAISESGSALCPWAFISDPKTIADEIAQNLEFNTTESNGILKGLLSKTRQEIIDAYPAENLLRGLTFAPVAEPLNSTEQIFISDNPYNILKSGNFNKVYYMTGFNDNEAIIFFNNSETVSQALNGIQQIPGAILPASWNIPSDSPEAKKIIDTIFVFYNHSTDSAQDLSDLVTDMQFVYPIDLSVRLHVSQQNQPVYYYTFSYDGVLNLAKKMIGVEKYSGASHGDELFYMWDNNATQSVKLTKEDSAYILRNRMIRLWTNFAKYG